MSDNPAPQAAGNPTPTPDSQSDPREAELSRLRDELSQLRSREGRFRNEKGVMAARIRELEQLALGNTTEPPPPGQPNFTGSEQGYAYNAYNAPQPPYQYQQQPAWQPPQPDPVTREEWDVDRFRREQPNRFEAVRQIALDGSRVQPYIRYRSNAYGQAVPDIYGTYAAIAERMELEELKKAQSASSPQRNPALATISGSSANVVEDQPQLQDMTPEKMRETWPEAFPPAENSPFWGPK